MGTERQSGLLSRIRRGSAPSLTGHVPCAGRGPLVAQVDEHLGAACGDDSVPPPGPVRFLGTGTLLSSLVARTERIRLFPDVAKLPLRHPPLIPKSAATLDVINGGRFELGLGRAARRLRARIVDRRRPRPRTVGFRRRGRLGPALLQPGEGRGRPPLIDPPARDTATEQRKQWTTHSRTFPPPPSPNCWAESRSWTSVSARCGTRRASRGPRTRSGASPATT
ncbi:LLM class flavin-dependent oxidoreductase [Streptomyces sp. NPDC002867]